MNKKSLIFIFVLFLVAMTAVSAENNDSAVINNANDDELALPDNDDKLGTTYFYDANEDEEYYDDTVITNNVVKYYGDTSKKFNVIVYDDDYNRQGGVYVSFGSGWDSLVEKRTNSNGVVSFPINYDLGRHSVMTYIGCEDGQSYYIAHNTVIVKSTIPTKSLSKYVNQKSKLFSIKFLDTKGRPLVGKFVRINVKGVMYNLKTNSKGFANFRINWLKVGKHKIIAYNSVSKEKSIINVFILKKTKFKSVVLPVKRSDFPSTKYINKHDGIYIYYETKYRQYNPGVFVEARYRYGLDFAKHIKLVKAKVWFKNKNTGKIITRSSSNTQEGYDVYFNLIRGYTPYKAQVWYV